MVQPSMLKSGAIGLNDCFMARFDASDSGTSRERGEADRAASYIRDVALLERIRHDDADALAEVAFLDHQLQAMH